MILLRTEFSSSSDHSRSIFYRITFGLSYLPIYLHYMYAITHLPVGRKVELSYPIDLTLFKGTPPEKRMFSFGPCPNFPPPPSPSFGQLVHLFRPSKMNIYCDFLFIRAGAPPPPLIRAMPERKHFFSREVFPYAYTYAP